VEGIDADHRLRGVPLGAHALVERRPHVHADRLDAGGAVGAEVVEEGVQGGGVLAWGAPDDLLGVVVGDQGQVVVVATPADLIDPDVDQPVQAVSVQAVGDHPLTDPPDGVPVDAAEAGDSGLVGLGSQVGDQVLEVAAEPRPGPGERDRLHPHPVLGTVQATQPGPHADLPATEVQVPPRRAHLPGVIPCPGAERAQRADQAPPSQRDVDPDRRAADERHVQDRDALQAQKAVECSGDAHGRPFVR